MKIIVPIIKNFTRYNNLKLAKGINLSLYTSVSKKDESGISSVSFGDRWFILPKGKAIFKTFDKGFYDNVRKNRIYNELLCSKLAKQVGIECAEYEPAFKKGSSTFTGLISYNILKQDELLIAGNVLIKKYIKIIKNIKDISFDEYQENSIEKYIKIFTMLKNNGQHINEKQIFEDLYKIVVFDALTFQTDRHNENVHFIYDKKMENYRVAPLIDNEFAFGVEYINNAMNDKYTFRNIIMQKFLDDYDMYAKLLYIKNNIQKKDKYKKQIEQIVKYSLKNEKLMEILIDISKKLDLDKAINELKKEGNVISSGYEEYIKNLFEYAKQSLKEAIVNLKNEESKNNNENANKEY